MSIRKKIKLTDDDITIHELGESFNHTFAYLEIYVDGSKNLTEIRQLKAQIINDIEKAELYDEFFDGIDISDTIEIVKDWREKTEWYNDIMAARNEVAKQNLTLATLQQENKQLKEYRAEIERLASDDSLWNNIVELDNLKEKLEKLKMFLAQYTIDEGDIIKVDAIKLKKHII